MRHYNLQKIDLLFIYLQYIFNLFVYLFTQTISIFFLSKNVIIELNLRVIDELCQSLNFKYLCIIFISKFKNLQLLIIYIIRIIHHVIPFFIPFYYPKY